MIEAVFGFVVDFIGGMVTALIWGETSDEDDPQVQDDLDDLAGGEKGAP